MLVKVIVSICIMKTVIILDFSALSTVELFFAASAARIFDCRKQ
ncbi:putative membrane protein [Duffyella gerundensis]|uniref:Putative membrane protein n=1 Tax=Duffyella gerundensis TaxID=1619313 RepID=A0A0U5KZ16_9GAMM|nr:putative membrane protein [Duffyella gerundensis]